MTGGCSDAQTPNSVKMRDRIPCKTYFRNWFSRKRFSVKVVRSNRFPTRPRRRMRIIIITIHRSSYLR